MQGARRVVDLVALAQGVQAVALARMQIARHAQRVGDLRAVLGDGLQVHQPQLVVEEAHVERRVVDDQLGAADELEELVRHLAKPGLVLQELRAQPVHLQRARLDLALAG